ncbi:MAG: hypothetical protein SLAVMIC_00858 [uncultured marine phage]|uniref:Uncharacterized protein n=1 Tax=uncultured marine phage TaxID=707152 RepID=A0A8D9C9P4_9VIRU|nr:MAG: hypothetical protein SLAVMIC_00858 [uncultured marine phage]
MKHKIEIKYQTGDSFNSEDTSDILELEWDDLDIAKENLKAIQEHYRNSYEPLNNRRWNDKRSVEEIIGGNKDKWWFVEKKLNNGNLDPYYAGNCIKLKTDNGDLMQISCYWCGYFETLYGAEIISVDNDMKFEL